MAIAGWNQNVSFSRDDASLAHYANNSQQKCNCVIPPHTFSPYTCPQLMPPRRSVPCPHTSVLKKTHNHTGPCCPCNGFLLEEDHPNPGWTIPPLWLMLPFTVTGSTHRINAQLRSGRPAQSSTDPNPKFPVPWLPSTCAGSREGSRARGQGSG